MSMMIVQRVQLGIESVLGGDTQFEWKKNESGLLVAIGTALETGIWQGVDGARIYYPPEVAGAMLAESLLGKPIGQDHPLTVDGTTPNVGSITATGKGYGRTDIEFIITDPLEADLVESGKRMLSIEADVGAKWDQSINAWHAYNIKGTRVSTVPKGACATCVIHTTRRTQLAAGDWKVFQQGNQQPPQQMPGQQQPGMPQQMNPQMIQQCMQALEASGFKVMPPQQQQPTNPQDQGSLQQSSFPGGVRMGNDNPNDKDIKKDDKKDIKKPQLKEPEGTPAVTPTVPDVVEPSTEVPDTPETPSVEMEELTGAVKEMQTQLAAIAAERVAEKDETFKANLASVEAQIKERLPAFDKKVWFESVGCDGSPGCAEVALKARLSTLPKKVEEVKLSVDLGDAGKDNDIETKILGVELKSYFENEYGEEEMKARGIEL